MLIVDHVEAVVLHDRVELRVTAAVGVEFDCDRPHPLKPRMVTLEGFHLSAFDIHLQEINSFKSGTPNNLRDWHSRNRAVPIGSHERSAETTLLPLRSEQAVVAPDRSVNQGCATLGKVLGENRKSLGIRLHAKATARKVATEVDRRQSDIGSNIEKSAATAEVLDNGTVDLFQEDLFKGHWIGPPFSEKQ